MATEEKRAWINAVVTAVMYAVYLVVILGRLADTPAADVPYVSMLLWTIGIAMVLAMVLTAVLAYPQQGTTSKDERDREISRFGEYVGQSFVVIGGVSALVMAMLELDHFWIANVIYLTFALSSILGSVAKIFAYRRAFQSW